MLRPVLAAVAIGFAFAALPAAAQSCDINADSAAVVAAWGTKVRDGSLPEDQLAAISAQIQQVPATSASDPDGACAILADLKNKLGI
jgi:hypothetical protein